MLRFLSSMMSLIISLGFAAPIDVSGNSHSPLLQKMKELKISKQNSDVKIKKLMQIYLTAPYNKDRLIAALAIGVKYKKSSPRYALQFLSSAGILCKSYYNEICDLIEYYKAEINYYIGYYSNTIETLTLLLKKSPKKIDKKSAYEFLIKAYYFNEQYKMAAYYYNKYKKLCAKLKLDPKVVKIAAMSFFKIKKFNKETAALEILALDYPITEYSKWALNKLILYNKKFEDHEYYFSKKLLKRISYNIELEPEIKNLIINTLNEPIVISKYKVEKLDLVDKVNFLLDLKFLNEAYSYLDTLIENVALVPKKEKSDYYYSIAKIYLFKNEHILANKYLKRALNFCLTKRCKRRTNTKLALSLEKAGNNLAAAKIFKSVKTLIKNSKWRYFWNLYKAKEYSQAAALLKNKEHINPLDSNEPLATLYWKAKIYEHLGFNDEAQNIYRSILSRDAASYYSNLIISSYPEITENKVKIVELANLNNFSSFPYQSKKNISLISSIITDNDNITNEVIHKPNLKIINDLLKVELNDAARIELKKIKANNIYTIPDRIVVSKLAWKTNDYYFTKKIAYNGHPFVESLNLDWWSLGAHQNMFKDVWKVSFPLAYKSIVDSVSDIVKINKFLIYSMMRSESNYNSKAVSCAGARGLLQIMPKTAVKIAGLLKDNEFKVKNLYDPYINIAYGGYYLKQLMNYYNNNMFLTIAAYNAGPIAVNNWIDQCKDCSIDEFVESIPYKETRQYVKAVIKNYIQYSKIYKNSEPSLWLGKLPETLSDDQFIF